MKKFFAKLINWESSRKSNWSKAMESQGLNENERKKIVEKAREELKKEQERVKNTQKSAEEEWKKAA